MTAFEGVVGDEDETKNEEEEVADPQLVYEELVSSLSWECPCGKKVYGPIQFFHHVKSKHEFDTLETLVQQRTLSKMFQHYPNIHRNEIRILEEMDIVPIEKAVEEIAKKHKEHYLSHQAPTSDEKMERGSYADMAIVFLRGVESAEGKNLMGWFFTFLEEFITLNMGCKAWREESPQSLLKYSNQIFRFFTTVREKYRPIDCEDTKRLIYLLAKWMFLNRWTNDRIFPNPTPIPSSSSPDSDDDCLSSSSPPEAFPTVPPRSTA